jgi:hydrogenase-4 component B
MSAIQLFLLSVGLFGAGALASLLLRSTASLARWLAGVACLAGSISGAFCVLIGAGPVLGGSAPQAIALLSIPPFGNLVIELDGLSLLIVAVISSVGIAASLSMLGTAVGQASIGFLTNLFMGAMLMVAVTSNTFFFLVFWELMTLASYLLVIWEPEKRESVRAGFIYMLVAHAGAALIMLAFLILFQKSGSFDFAAIRQLSLAPGLRSLIFFLVFLGFGAKAGMVPLHFWAPDAYAAAPSHISALMSSVMKKTAVYGLLRVCVDLLGLPLWWWGVIVLIFGALSVVVGAFYALAERNLKRLLAYSSVENVGIILMGVGLGMTGLALNQPVLASLGLVAALYHLLNHAFFKALLFLSAGSVIDQSGTVDLNRMGGLSRRMPWTALIFLIGALSVSAIPPFNGFVSEWFTYQSILAAGRVSYFSLRVLAPLCAVCLALAGALAVMVYIKAFGGAFSGPARSQGAGAAREAGGLALASQIYLALGCLALGLGAPWVAAWIANIAANFSGGPAVVVSGSWAVFPLSAGQAVLSTPLIAILLIGLLFAPLLIVAMLGGRRVAARSDVEPWSCGYGYSTPMSLPASGFDQPVKSTFQPLYLARRLVEKPFQVVGDFSRIAVQNIHRAEPLIETVVTRPVARLVETAGQWIQALQMGDIRVYCLYIIITLAVLLILSFGRSGL